MNKNKQRTYLWVGLSIIFVLLAIFFALSFANKERQQKVMPIKTTAPKKKVMIGQICQLDKLSVYQLFILI